MYTGITGSCDYFYKDALLIIMDSRRRHVAESTKPGVQCILATNQNYPDCLHCPYLLIRDSAMIRLFEEGSKETIEAEIPAHSPRLLTAASEGKFRVAHNDFCECGMSN